MIWMPTLQKTLDATNIEQLPSSFAETYFERAVRRIGFRRIWESTLPESKGYNYPRNRCSPPTPGRPFST